MTARELQTGTFEGPGPESHHQNSTKRPPKRGRKNENSGRGRKKKREIFGPPPFEPPSFGAPASGAPPPDPPLRRPAQNFVLFSLSDSIFALFLSLSGGLLVEFWWCLKRRCQLCTFGLTCCRVKPRCKTTRTILQKICPPLPKKSKTKDCKLHKIQKKTSNTTEIPPSGPTPLGPHFFRVLLFVLFVLLLILLLDAGFSCCVLFFLLFVLLLLPLLRLTVVFGVAFVAPASCSVAAACVALFFFFAALLLLLLRVLSGRRQLKNQSLPAFDLPNCFCRLFFLLFVLLAVLLLFGTVCAAACAACWLCFFQLLLLLSFCLFVLLLPPLGRRPLKNPPLPLLTFQNVKNNLTIDQLPIARRKSITQNDKIHRYLKKSLEKPKFHEKTPVRTFRDLWCPAFWALVSL